MSFTGYGREKGARPWEPGEVGASFPHPRQARSSGTAAIRERLTFTDDLPL
jgi:hypothetical protein